MYVCISVVCILFLQLESRIPKLASMELGMLASPYHVPDLLLKKVGAQSEFYSQEMTLCPNPIQQGLNLMMEAALKREWTVDRLLQSLR